MTLPTSVIWSVHDHNDNSNKCYSKLFCQSLLIQRCKTSISNKHFVEPSAYIWTQNQTFAVIQQSLIIDVINYSNKAFLYKKFVTKRLWKQLRSTYLYRDYIQILRQTYFQIYGQKKKYFPKNCKIANRISRG